MKFRASCLLCKFSDVDRFYSCSWHDDDPASALLNQFGKKRCSVGSCGFETGGEHSFATRFDQCVKCSMWIRGSIKCTVAGHTQRSCPFNNTFHHFDVDSCIDILRTH